MDSIILHISIVLALIWILNCFNYCHSIVYFLSLIYIYQIHEGCNLRLRRKLQHEERKEANGRRPLADIETVKWLNDAVEKVWPICMEHIVSQKILLPIIPWFLEKYKPWTAKKVMVQQLYLGRNPPTFTHMRVLRQSSEDDDLVLELGMSFLTAEDMSTIIDVKLRRRLGFGMWAKLHMTGMHVEGKVLVGIKFLHEFPYLGSLRICFVEPPYFQMTVKPIFSHGLDVTELPGIAGWMDKLLAIVFEKTLVEPNMLVVDVEKFTSGTTGNWFSVDEKEPIAYAKIVIVEGADMQPSDSNGLADPYVKGQLGPYRFRTKTQKRTLSPKWVEEFKIPICTWDSPNVLALEVCDKDHFRDDSLGDCSLNISDYRATQRHDVWLPLQNIKMGRLHLAVTVFGVCENAPSDKEVTTNIAGEAAEEAPDSSISLVKDKKLEDKFEPMYFEGQNKAGIHNPGIEVPQIAEPRKRKSMLSKIQIHRDGNFSPDISASPRLQNSNNCSDENAKAKGSKSILAVQRGITKVVLAFDKLHRNEDSKISPRASSSTSHDNICGVSDGFKTDKESLNTGKNDAVSSRRENAKAVAKSMLKRVLSPKGLKVPKDDSGSSCSEIEFSQKSGSSSEDSLTSPRLFTPAVTSGKVTHF